MRKQDPAFWTATLAFYMEGTREPWEVLEQSFSVSLCTPDILAWIILCEGPSWALWGVEPHLGPPLAPCQEHLPAQS